MDTNSKIYFDSNLTLCKTLVIKSDIAANSINDHLIKNNYGYDINYNDKTTWKYYKNITGEYHEKDETMYVISLDNLENIVFSKANLEVHTATLEAYSYGTRYYYSLINKYPKQEQLILGILYPANMENSINAENGSILSYPNYLVEEQEITLINELDDYIKRYLVKWNVEAFGLSDSLYNSAQHAIFYLNLLPKLLNLRLKRCKTLEAHSFHIRQYLASHGYLDKYMPYLNLKQILYLYRNIRYIERNSGKTEQFKELINVFLSAYNIPLDELSVRQLNSFDEKYYPDIRIRKKTINKQYNASEKDYYDVNSLLNKTEYLNDGNHDYLDTYRNNIIKNLKNSNSAIIQSKELESNMIDYTDAVPDPLDNVLLREWINLASKGLYTSIVTFKDTKSLLSYSLKAIDAFIYMYYITLRLMKVDVQTIPPYINIKQRKLVLPTKEEMLSVVDSNFKDLPAKAIAIINNQPEIILCPSIKSFYNLAYNIYKEAHNHWFNISDTGDLYKRALLANMIETIYEDEIVILAEEDTLFSEWLIEKNLPEYDYNNTEALKLIEEIFTKATGLINDENKKLVNIQAYMISIIRQLSSYSIQFIYNVNESKVKVLNWAAIRPGNFQQSINSFMGIYGLPGIVDEFNTTYTYINAEDTSEHEESFTQVHDYTIDLTDPDTSSVHMDYTTNIEVYVKSYTINISYPEYDALLSKDAPFIGIEYFMALSDEEKKLVKSLY